MRMSQRDKAKLVHGNTKIDEQTSTRWLRTRGGFRNSFNLREKYDREKIKTVQHQINLDALRGVVKPKAVLKKQPKVSKH